MMKNQFFPFTSGPKGGKVGPWILFGDNYAKLNAILAKGRSIGVSVAPILRTKSGAKAPYVYKHQEAVGGLKVAVYDLIDHMPAYAKPQKRMAPREAVVPVSTIHSTSQYDTRETPILSVDQNFIKGAVRLGKVQAAFGQPIIGSMIAHIAERRKNVSAQATWMLDKASSALALRSFSSDRRVVLPSVAPVGRYSRSALLRTTPVSRHGADADLSSAKVHQKTETRLSDCTNKPPVLGAATLHNTRQISAALKELLNSQGRLPPSGTTAFDPRLTPTWSGLKLPA